VSIDIPDRDECSQCGGTLGYQGKAEPDGSGHHPSLMVCGECGAEVLRG
jgi:ribosomal protein S27AE